jgi:hypothetical protein
MRLFAFADLIESSSPSSTRRRLKCGVFRSLELQAAIKPSSNETMLIPNPSFGPLTVLAS